MPAFSDKDLKFLIPFQYNLASHSIVWPSLSLNDKSIMSHKKWLNKSNDIISHINVCK